MPKRACLSGLVIGLLAVACLQGCARKTNCNPDGTPSAASFAVHGEKPSEEEARQFAYKLEKAATAGNIAEGNGLIDWDTLFDFATDTAEGSSEFRDGFIKGAKKGVVGPKSFMNEIVALTSRGGSYKFLHCHEHDGQLRVLFRVLLPDGGVNYHDLIVLKYSDSVRAADVYIAASGELLSQTMRRLYLSALASESPSFLAKENDHDADLAKNVGKFKEMAEALVGKNPKKAIAIYNALPENIKGEKTFLLIRLQAVQAMDDATEYRKVLDDFRRYHPDDPTLDLINIDHYFLTKEFDKLLAAIDHIDAKIGSDPFLNVLRANAFLAQGKNGKALQYARKASTAEKGLKVAYEMELNISLADGKYADVARLLSLLEHEFHESVDLTLDAPEFAAFKASKEYSAWQKTRR